MHSSDSQAAQRHSETDENALARALYQGAYVTNLTQFLGEPNDLEALRYWVDEFVPLQSIKSAHDIHTAVTRSIADIDQLINDQVNAIIHHPRFQKLEASWRGLWYLVEQADGAHNVKVKLLDISWAEISKDIGRALEFDQSQLFHKIYSEEYGTPGGEPYGAIIGDYEISHRTSPKHPYDDILTLEGIAQVAAAAFSPFFVSASSELFGADDFSALGMPINLEGVFVQTEYNRWRAFREKLDSRFVGITAPRMLMRRPYLSVPGSYRGVYFYEQCAGTDSRNYLWGSSCYAFAVILIREFATVGWFGHIRGVQRSYLSGGLVTTLPVDFFLTDTEGIAPRPVTDVVITDSIERELSELGIIPFCQCYQSPYAAFYNNQSAHQAKAIGRTETQVNAKLSAMLQHVLCGARIAHYIKVMIRDKIGSFITADACEDYLRNWLYQYTTSREDVTWQDQSRYPLREAKVQVRENPRKPGQFLCVIYLRPHYQLDSMVSELQLVTELASLG